MRGMKTCLGILILVPAILVLVGTGVYHTSLDTGLTFEERDTNGQYINTQRSYRPAPKPQPAPAAPDAKAPQQAAQPAPAATKPQP